jgi:hypothetical protein
LKGLTIQVVAASLETISTQALLVALSMTLLNQFLLEPLAATNMMKLYSLEETSNGPYTKEYKRFQSNFGELRSLTFLMNLVALCAAAIHGFVLSASL